MSDAACRCELPFNGAGSDWDASKCSVHASSSAKFGESKAGPVEASAIRQPDSPIQTAAWIYERAGC